MNNRWSESSPNPGDRSQRRVVAPSEALNRFELPEGFVPVASTSSAKGIRFGFRAAGLALLIRDGVASEALAMKPLALIPNGPAWLLGVMNLRGNLIPVCDIGRVLGGGSASSGEKQMILVLDKGDNAAGFIMDGYPRALVDLRALGQVPALPESLAPFVRAAFSAGGEVWLELEHDDFLAAAAGATS